MPSQIERLGLDHLNTQDRLTLIDELWETIGGEIEAAPISDKAAAEIRRRLEAHKADPSRTVPWEEVEARLLERMEQ